MQEAVPSQDSCTGWLSSRSLNSYLLFYTREEGALHLVGSALLLDAKPSDEGRQGLEGCSGFGCMWHCEVVPIQ